jgi:hypothetical protein
MAPPSDEWLNPEPEIEDVFHDATDEHVNVFFTLNSDEHPHGDLDYVCKLSPELQAYAAKELNEDPKRRTIALREFRDKIKANPRIKNCRLGK